MADIRLNGMQVLVYGLLMYALRANTYSFVFWGQSEKWRFFSFWGIFVYEVVIILVFLHSCGDFFF